jgi:hypothetical protein
MLCIGNFLPTYQWVIKLVQLVKEIKGHSYPISSALSVNSAVAAGVIASAYSELALSMYLINPLSIFTKVLIACLIA